ncbi:MAG: hypothetical protein IPK62_14590 [Bacteroidetes bacterium]|nr:hypothetical protein [Bacteroidota bacterium]
MALYSMKEALNKMLEQSRWKERYLAEKIKLDWGEINGNHCGETHQGFNC